MTEDARRTTHGPNTSRTHRIPYGAHVGSVGLLLVFRVNNLYGRVIEGRLLWGRVVFCCRQAAQTVATSLLFDETLPPEKAPAARTAAARVCRYLAAFPWELNAKLTALQAKYVEKKNFGRRGGSPRL